MSGYDFTHTHTPHRALIHTAHRHLPPDTHASRHSQVSNEHLQIEQAKLQKHTYLTTMVQAPEGWTVLHCQADRREDSICCLRLSHAISPFQCRTSQTSCQAPGPPTLQGLRQAEHHTGMGEGTTGTPRHFSFQWPNKKYNVVPRGMLS